EAGDDWWNASRQEIDRVFGEDAPVFKAFVAIGSWQKPTDINLDLAIRAYNAYKTGRPFEGVRTADGERAFSGQQVKALTAAT
ncbi:MAG: hypothetical protein GWO00_20295, partial [Gemmatimonadetes bacterium]|nr:hypothetical protein [Gemmatimonadota bacterium]NIW66252.1 hypothetical protein [Gemmatimonadota bacterium]